MGTPGDAPASVTAVEMLLWGNMSGHADSCTLVENGEN